LFKLNQTESVRTVHSNRHRFSDIKYQTSLIR